MHDEIERSQTCSSSGKRGTLSYVCTALHVSHAHGRTQQHSRLISEYSLKHTLYLQATYWNTCTAHLLSQPGTLHVSAPHFCLDTCSSTKGLRSASDLLVRVLEHMHDAPTYAARHTPCLLSSPLLGHMQQHHGAQISKRPSGQSSGAHARHTPFHSQALPVHVSSPHFCLDTCSSTEGLRPAGNPPVKALEHMQDIPPSTARHRQSTSAPLTSAWTHAAAPRGSDQQANSGPRSPGAHAGHTHAHSQAHCTSAPLTSASAHAAARSSRSARHQLWRTRPCVQHSGSNPWPCTAGR
eukprot:1158634-Pelagomonas_calceolata.AAC.4